MPPGNRFMHGLFFQPPIEANFWGHIFEEVYKTGLFESLTPKVRENSVVIDCGANVGITSYYFSSRFETVYAIEPAKEHFDVLTHMLSYNKIENVKPFQFALSMKDGKEKFYHYSNKTMFSLYGNIMGTGGLAQTGFEEVPLKRLDTFVTEQKIKHIDLLKLDVEGVEFEILGSDSFTKVAPIIDSVVVEVHTYSGRNPNQVVDSLVQNGFTVSRVPNDALLFIARK